MIAVKPEDILFTSPNGLLRLIKERSMFGQDLWLVQKPTSAVDNPPWKTLFTSDDRTGLWRELARRKIDDPALSAFIQTQLPEKAS